jgi:hypothetical protein
MAGRLDLHEDTIVGKLHCLWSWADRHTTDGHAAGVGLNWVDRLVNCAGFAEALVAVGWLVVELHGIEFPNFDRHNGETAKRRAVKTRQKQMSRIRGDKMATREEKSREEKRPASGSVSIETPATGSKATRVPAGYEEAGACASGRSREQGTTEMPRLSGGAPRRSGAAAVQPKPSGASVFDSLSVAVLRDDRRLAGWLRDASRHRKPVIQWSEQNLLLVFGAAERALEVGENPVALFAALVAGGQRDKISQAQEFRAAKRLKALARGGPAP